MEKFFQKLQKLDRRVIYFMMFLVVALPFLTNYSMPFTPGEKVRDVYRNIEELAAKPDPVLLISLDYEPATLAELQPMAVGLLHHAFKRNIKVIGMTFLPNGTTLADDTLKTIADIYGKVYGKDYIFLGFKPVANVVMRSMGKNFRDGYPEDYSGKPLDSFEIMQGVRNFDDVGLVISLSGTALIEYWIMYVVQQFHPKFVFGCTAVMASDYYPYLQSGQAKGMLGGMSGAAEYEILLKENGVLEKLGDAARGMNSLSAAHLLIILFIFLGNIAHFITRKSRKAGAK